MSHVLHVICHFLDDMYSVIEHRSYVRFPHRVGFLFQILRINDDYLSKQY
jgi:hypothetical protein